MNIIVKEDIIWKLFKWALFILMLDSLHAWIFWGITSPFIIPILFILISAGMFVLKPDLFWFSRKSVLVIIVLYLLALFGGTRGNLNAYLGMIITSLNVLIFIGLNDKYKIDYLNFFTKAFSILIGISLLGWIIHLLGLSMPYSNVSYGFSEQRNEAQYFFQNYYFFLENEGTKYLEILVPRFSSVFLEPGYLGIILIILLYLNKFNFKNKYNIILLIALVFTLSLASWLLGLFVYIAFVIRNNKNRIRTIILISVGVFGFYSFFNSYNNGKNIIYETIISRVKYDDSRGTISGYNRTDENFDYWFKFHFLRSSDILLGVDVQGLFRGTTNVGWKVYWANYGLVGLTLYLLFLFYPFIKNKHYSSFIFLFLYIMIFARGHYIINFSVFPILYLCGFAKLKYRPKKVIKQISKHYILKSNAKASVI